MSSQSPSTRLLEALQPLFREEGLSLTKAGVYGTRFEKKTALGAVSFFLTFDGRGGWVRVKPGFNLRFTELEEWFQKILGVHPPACLSTYVSTLEPNFNGLCLYDQTICNLSREQLKAYTAEQRHPQAKIEESAQVLFDLYRKHAKPIFESIKSFDQLYAVLLGFLQNNTSMDRTLFRLADNTPCVQACYGLLLAAGLERSLSEVQDSIIYDEGPYFPDIKPDKVRNFICQNNLAGWIGRSAVQTQSIRP